VVFADEPGKLALIRRACQGYQRAGVPVEWLDADGVRQCEPAFSHDGILGGAFCPLNGQLNPLLLTRALAMSAQRAGARLLLGTEVRGIAQDGGRVRAVQTTAGDIPCGFVVNAAGAWAADIGAMVGLELPVIPARGQILLTEPVPRFIHRVVSGSEPSARQTRRGNVIIGSTVENVGFDKRVTAATIDHFARGVLPHYPRLRGLSVIRAWAGLRPASPDHKPIIELCDEPQACALSASRRGICASGRGQLVMELITGRGVAPAGPSTAPGSVRPRPARLEGKRARR
jgi:glycine/D-amino acid oxidase-like deaminating enzyme